MAFLEIYFFSVRISLIFDHEPTKHWQVVPTQKADKGTLIILGLCKQCIFHYAQTSVEVLNRYWLLNRCSLGPHTNCDHEKVLLDANNVVLSGHNEIWRPPAARVSLLTPFRYTPHFWNFHVTKFFFSDFFTPFGNFGIIKTKCDFVHKNPNVFLQSSDMWNNGPYWTYLATKLISFHYTPHDYTAG